MRTYYIFIIRKDIYNISNKNPENLYKLLESIYLLDKKDVYIGYKLFFKLCKTINKKNLNKLLKDNYINNLSYTYVENTHIINDFLNNETTKLNIFNSHIRLKTSSYYPIFFNTLKNIPNIFICDFINMDYFFLNSINYNTITT